MVLQAFLDESFDEDCFCLAGYLASPQRWENFSQDWAELLQYGTLNKNNDYHFKMMAMGSCEERKNRVIAFYRVIQRYAEIAISISFRSSDLQNAIDRITVPGIKVNWVNWHNPYILAFRALTDVINRRRNDLFPFLDKTETIEFIFDERHEKKLIIKAWQTIKDKLPNKISDLYAVFPSFQNDQKYLPLQAADLWAWWIREWTKEFGSSHHENMNFPWEHDKNIPPKIFLFFDEEGIIEYLTLIGQPMLPNGKYFEIRPKS